ncbi:MAG: hypothetical protein L6R40_003222 [Gallowayella cf. fulva]|nr:MAG: hypothetical protein L6R40_003222 [Xanthomendoza cf. fulva]
MKSKERRRGHFEDAYAREQARQRKDANLARQAELKEQRAAVLGDPIRGVTTPFIRSLDSDLPFEVTTTVEDVAHTTTSPSPDEPPPSPANALDETHLNYYLTKPELESSLDYSRSLSEPLVATDRGRADPQKEAHEAKIHDVGHKIATEAISRIVSLGNASSKERTRANVQRIIETFGRHRTDNHLRPKAPSLQSTFSTTAEQKATPRVGPDTGSSEVQIGILTAKIRILADRYEGANRNDKVNKRNLRLLLHKRQKLLKYMQKKERGSDRWVNMIEKLGLTEATWKGQIAVQ